MVGLTSFCLQFRDTIYRFKPANDAAFTFSGMNYYVTFYFPCFDRHQYRLFSLLTSCFVLLSSPTSFAVVIGCRASFYASEQADKATACSKISALCWSKYTSRKVFLGGYNQVSKAHCSVNEAKFGPKNTTSYIPQWSIMRWYRRIYDGRRNITHSI